MEGGEIYSSPTGKQNTAICSGRTDWNDYSERNIQFWDFFFPPLHLICHEVPECSDQTESEWAAAQQSLPKHAFMSASVTDTSWFVRRAVSDEKVRT